MYMLRSFPFGGLRWPPLIFGARHPQRVDDKGWKAWLNGPSLLAYCTRGMLWGAGLIGLGIASFGVPFLGWLAGVFDIAFGLVIFGGCAITAALTLAIVLPLMAIVYVARLVQHLRPAHS